MATVLALRSLPGLAIKARAVRPTTARRALVSFAPRCQQARPEDEAGGASSVPARREAAAPALLDPFADWGLGFPRMNSLMSEFDALSRAFGMPSMMAEMAPLRSQAAKTLTLAVDVKEMDDRFEVVADVPGMKAEDVKVSVSPDNVLTLSAERKSEVKEEEEGRVRIERSYGSFVRRFKLPEAVDVDGIKASVKEGELLLTIPKTEVKAPEAREIKVEQAE